MSVSSKAGILGSNFKLVDIPDLVSLYYERHVDCDKKDELIAFGTSGHRGSSFDGSFLQDHIKALTYALILLRKKWGHTGPVFIGKDTHALSLCAFKTVVEVLVANDVDIVLDKDFHDIPTPVLSYQILRFNETHTQKADGIILTPSHNPPEDGGFKYNPPYAGPAVGFYTKDIENLANEILKDGTYNIKMMPFKKALESFKVHFMDMHEDYINNLDKIINMNALKSKDFKVSINPQGGSSLYCWEMIDEKYKLDLDIINKKIDPTFSFMPYDYNGRIRMDCISPYTMKILVDRKDEFDLGVANDPDSDRHGIVTKKGLLKSPKYLSIILDYLLDTRDNWPKGAFVGKSIGSSHLIDAIVKGYGFNIYETAIGFKYVAEDISKSKIVFGCEDSAGATFLDFKARPYSSDKDGIVAALIGMELMAIKGITLDDYLDTMTDKYGIFYYGRDDIVIDKKQKDAFFKLDASAIKDTTIASSQVLSVFDSLHDIKLRGIKVVLKDGFFAARPSGTENIYKIYYESKVSEDHANEILHSAKDIINKVTGFE